MEASYVVGASSKLERTRYCVYVCGRVCVSIQARSHVFKSGPAEVSVLEGARVGVCPLS